MMTTEAMHTAEFNDAELVAESLAGNRDAFRRIVERYQTLISSLAYCATGNVSQSEDLAQETFVSAWKQLADLREPAKLRPWLCSITRFLISKEFRRQGREPAHAAESLEADEWASPEPLPPDQIISDEEKAILWRSLERIPEIYREPLVLFYREHQSIEAVAQDLGLSEDAVKQRLSRGRKLLQEQFLAFVAGALKQTSPGKTFTLGVIAALPLLATTAKAATAGATAAKGGAMAKATGAGAFFQAIAALSPILLLGGFFGFKMGGDARQSSQQRESVATFWRIIVGSLAAFIMLPFLLLIILNILPVDFSGDFRQRVMHGMTIWLGLMYAVVPAALILWAWQRRRKFQSQPACEPEVAVNPRKKKRLVLWLVIAMIGTACLLGLVLSDTNKEVQHITAAEVQKMVADGKVKGAEHFCIMQFQNGCSNFWVTLRENGRRTNFWAPVNDATLALIKEQGIKCPTYVSGRDFEVFGWPGRFLPVFCIFILAIGGVVLLRKPGKFNPQEMDAQQTRKTQQVERMANKVFGTGVALVLIAAAVLLGLMIRWGIHNISGPEARQIIAEHKDIHCEVFQFNNGTKELWLTLNGSRHYPNFITPADEPTLALLAEQKIAYRTFIQGRDFGFRGPGRWMSLLCISVLSAGAVFVLWWAWKKERRFPAPAESHV
ncbi:MAG: RNA polymerase sigma factor [Verrucomicrobiota bacterium]|jgi:RNA polymerase sigma factor (sigma-70 family)